MAEFIDMYFSIDIICCIHGPVLGMALYTPMNKAWNIFSMSMFSKQPLGECTNAYYKHFSDVFQRTSCLRLRYLWQKAEHEKHPQQFCHQNNLRKQCYKIWNIVRILWISEKESIFKLISLSNTGIHLIWFDKWKLIYSWSPNMELSNLSMIVYLWWGFGLLVFLDLSINLSVGFIRTAWLIFVTFICYWSSSLYVENLSIYCFRLNKIILSSDTELFLFHL